MNQDPHPFTKLSKSRKKFALLNTRLSDEDVDPLEGGERWQFIDLRPDNVEPMELGCQCRYRDPCGNHHPDAAIDLRASYYKGRCKLVFPVAGLSPTAVDHIIELWQVKKGESSTTNLIPLSY